MIIIVKNFFIVLIFDELQLFNPLRDVRLSAKQRCKNNKKTLCIQELLWILMRFLGLVTYDV